MTTQPAQQEAGPVALESRAWIGGHGTEP